MKWEMIFSKRKIDETKQETLNLFYNSRSQTVDAYTAIKSGLKINGVLVYPCAKILDEKCDGNSI